MKPEIVDRGIMVADVDEADDVEEEDEIPVPENVISFVVDDDD